MEEWKGVGGCHLATECEGVGIWWECEIEKKKSGLLGPMLLILLCVTGVGECWEGEKHTAGEVKSPGFSLSYDE